ncbi:siroheme synthase CysG [Aliikangiella coralliicola]|uniref:Uroporphyrinogen-III C-methyltransferase n=1 Tax=Aliikangiella coralliicola TaxID=2592383 RepID=A0A545U554_9GAMM|nr:siroheme synthase CysG [Aliikangiella coralliicola]TQV84584.1 uroporphyrinogen-III C-methyltransferase [Aliikangiella coralliicola]
MDYLPITVQMKGRRCLIVGGGDVAARKLKHLLKSDSLVTMVSHDFCEEVAEIAENNGVELIRGSFTPDILDNIYLVIAATDDRMANRQVSIAAQQRNVWVNVVDDLELSTFIMPAVIDRSPLLIAVSSSGVSPVLARKIREKIEWLLPRSLGKLLLKLKGLRPEIKKKFKQMTDKRSFSEWYIESALKDENQLEKDTHSLFEDYQNNHRPTGKVYIVGAGPGAVDLLTVKALKLIQKADVVLHDALVSEEILASVRKDATLVYVGKRSSQHFVTQDRTNELLVEYAQKGLSVVRLKGGDPFIFGRGGEEIQVLAEHGVDYEVVPGVTAAAGCASYAGIPLTHRDHSQSVRFVTAHEKGTDSKVDWQSLAKENQTLVFYMGLMRSKKISDSLIKHGGKPSTPVAIVAKGTTSDQKVVVGELHELSLMVDRYSIQAPALIIVGEVAKLAKDLHWFKHGQLIEAKPELSKIVNQ